MNKRILLGALLGVTAAIALPSAANAAATCNYDQAKREMQVRYGSADTNVTVSNNAEIKYSEAGGFLRRASRPPAFPPSRPTRTRSRSRPSRRRRRR